MNSTENLTKKHDFVEVKYTGFTSGKVFDSNIAEDLKVLDPKAEPEKTIVIIGEKMVVPGLDNALVGKELNKQYEASFGPTEGFGPRDRQLIQILPIKAFYEQRISPQVGMTFVVDNRPVKILSVSGARVTVDFNNPMSGKDLMYKFSIVRFVTDEKEKIETTFRLLFRFMPEYELEGNTITIKGQKGLDVFINAFNARFKELTGKELAFKEFTKEELEARQKAQEEREKEMKKAQEKHDKEHHSHDHSLDHHDKHEHNHDHKDNKHVH